MKCHYEVLEAARDADSDVLKKQYRKMALKFHPDKNPDDPEGAKQTFQVIQQAYDVLSDPQERAWYDNHREQILRGGLGEKLEDEGIDLFQYFSSSCYSGFTDEETGFYGVYDEVFNTLAKEDMDFIDDEDSDFEIPCFGKSMDDYEGVVGPFYAYWSSYSTPRSFSWLDKYDTRQGENRWVKRKMEAENKKVRDKARKERNEAVRNLVQFVRKRDKRVLEYSKKLQEKAEMNKKKTQEFQKKQREERKKLFETGGGSGGFGMNEMEEQLRQLEGQYTTSESDSDNEDMGSEEDLGEELDDLYCVACDKVFRTVGAKENHETSKKHRDNLERLVEEMNEEEVGEINEGDDSEEVYDEEDVEDNEEEKQENCEEISLKDVNGIIKEETLLVGDDKLENYEKVKDINKSSVSELDSDNSRNVESKSKRKKEKKKRKKKLPNLIVESDSEQSVNNEFLKSPASSSDESNNRKKKGKGKNKKSKKDKSPPVNCSKIPTDLINEVETNELNNVVNVGTENKVLEENVLDIEEITIIKASDEKTLHNYKKSNSKTNVDVGGIGKGDLACAQCRKSFASKNKLFNHLKSSGHAVYLPDPETKPAGKSKRKNKK